MNPPKKKKRIDKGGSQPESKSKQVDGAQSLTLGENDEQFRVSSSSPEGIGLNITTEDRWRVWQRSIEWPDDVALTATSKFYMITLCLRSGPSFNEYDYDMSLMGYIHWFDDRCLSGNLTSSQKAEALSYALDAHEAALENLYLDRDYLDNVYDEIYSRWPIEDTSIYTIRRKQDLGEYYITLKSVVSHSKRMIAERRNANTATRVGSDVTGVQDEEKAWEGMPGLTEPTSELSESGENDHMSTLIEGVMSVLEECAPLTPGRTSDSALPANIDLQGNVSSGSHIDGTAGPGTSSVDDEVESPLHETDDDWELVVRNRTHLAGPYHKYRKVANELWDSANSLKNQAATAYRIGNTEEAKRLSDEAKMLRAKAEQADERASQAIFELCNKDYIVDHTINLHGQHKKEGMERFLRCLEFGVYGRCWRQLRVITGYGSHLTGPSVLKESVIKLLGDENIKWEYGIIRRKTNGIERTEENLGVLLIKFDGENSEKRELDFVKCRSCSN